MGASPVVYLSGPMSGQDIRFLPFHEAAAQLRRMGWAVVNPAELETTEDIAVDPDGCHRPPEHDYAAYLRRDLLLLLRDCDLVAVLPGWHASRGARLEVDTARAVGIPVYRYVEHPAGGRLDRLGPKHLVGFVGRKRAGKDKAAEALVELGWRRLAFADALRSQLLALNPLVARDGWHVRLSELVDALGWDDAKGEVPEVRRLMQQYGTEVVRDGIGQGVWADIVERQLEVATDRVVLTDVRFDNEVELVRRYGGLIVLVTRPGRAATDGHASESLPDRIDPDIILPNDGTLDELRTRARRIGLSVVPRRARAQGPVEAPLDARPPFRVG